VAGEVVVEHGRVLTVDEAALKAEVRELATEYRSGLAATAKSAALLSPYYRKMYLRALATEVGMNRLAGPMSP
jgi:5-methylthioadenosine/S-adenosylhomocysteine deaminase